MADALVIKKSKKKRKPTAAEPEVPQEVAEALSFQPKVVASISVKTEGGLLGSNQKNLKKKRKATVDADEQPAAVQPPAEAPEPQAAAEPEQQPKKRRKKHQTAQDTAADPEAAVESTQQPIPTSLQAAAEAAATDGASRALAEILETAAMPARPASSKKKRKKVKMAAADAAAPLTPALPELDGTAVQPKATPAAPTPAEDDQVDSLAADGKKKKKNKKKRKSGAAEEPAEGTAAEPSAVITTTLATAGPDSAQAVSTSMIVPKSAVKVGLLACCRRSEPPQCLHVPHCSGSTL